MILFEEARALYEELVLFRRDLHQNPELGLETFETSARILNELKNACIPAQQIGSGVVAKLGQGNEVLVLRADMDALPLTETSELPFSAKGNAAHCCGHDLHATMLLGAAKLLKKHEDKLNYPVLFVFQPGEETGDGALHLLENNLLHGLSPIGLIGIHVDAKAPFSRIDYGYGSTFASNDSFTIEFFGQGGHGARPYECIDPLLMATSAYEMLNRILYRESDPFDHSLFSVTSIVVDSSHNTITDKAVMKGTLRCYDEDVRSRLKKRISTIVKDIASLYGGKATVDYIQSMPGVRTDEQFTSELLDFLPAKKHFAIGGEVVKRGSEDFCYLSKEIPRAAYFFLGAGPNTKEGYPVGQHHPAVIFNEEVLPLGAWMLAHFALSLDE